jgi:hypothetical protein
LKSKKTVSRQILKKVEAKGTPHFYVIRNSRLATEWKSIEPRVTAIAGRSISSLIRTQGIGDLFRLYQVGHRRPVSSVSGLEARRYRF